MKIFLTVIAFVIAKADASEIWMQMLSDEIVQASNFANNADPIPVLADSLGLTKLVELIKRAGLTDALSGQGNGLAGEKIVVNPLVTDEPSLDQEFVAVENEIHDLFPAYAVTRAMAKKALENDVDKESFSLASTFIGQAFDDVIFAPGPFTLFGPTNEAFRKLDRKFVELLLKNNTLLGEILKFHVMPDTLLSKDIEDNIQVGTLDGDKTIRFNIYKDSTVITAQGRQVIKPDQMAKNGVIHVVDSVLFPAPGDLVYAVSNCPVFSTLAKAVDLAGLVDTLQGKGPFTLFAPTNEAFEHLPPGVLDGLLKNKTALADVLTYHVVDGALYSPGLSSGSLPTVEGKNIQIKVTCMGVIVNQARVIYPDASAFNGVMHVINRVLIPPTAHYQMLLKR